MKDIMFQPIRGTNIVLRKYQIADSIAINSWWNDIECTKWMGPKFRNKRTQRESRNSLKKIINNKDKESIYFAIADINSSEYIGGIDLTSIDYTDRRGILTVVIGRKESRGKGIGAEAVNIILKYAFETLGLNKVELRVSSGNIQAIKCYKKCGFIEVGKYRNHNYIDEKYYDILFMDIINSEKKET